MNGLNSRFAAYAGSLVSTLVIHLGGFVGVGTVFSSIYAFTVLDASAAVALSLLGQTLFSIGADSSGFLGRKRYPVSARSLPGIGLAFAGVAIMVGNRRSSALAMLIALASGALPGLSFVLNSELGRRKGTFRSVRLNYLVGLATTLAIVAAARPPVSAIATAARAVAAAGPLLALGGGLMGVAVATAVNLIFPRMAAFSATLLLFSGQALAGILIDAFTAGTFDASKLVGTLVLLAGLAINGRLAERSPGRGQPRPRL
jgi:uncharacterized membrane protein YdcZ (DUF606 family)